MHRLKFETPKPPPRSCLVKHAGGQDSVPNSSLVSFTKHGYIIPQNDWLKNGVEWHCEHYEIHRYLVKKFLGSSWMNNNSSESEGVLVGQTGTYVFLSQSSFRGIKNGGLMVEKQVFANPLRHDFRRHAVAHWILDNDEVNWRRPSLQASVWW